MSKLKLFLKLKIGESQRRMRNVFILIFRSHLQRELLVHAAIVERFPFRKHLRASRSNQDPDMLEGS